ncbi:MAG: NAD(P)H-binding protein [candidate division NC10 bacterium]|nr:NAD(P)H-binding protein [candidate division NC10 bacterium]
MILVTGAGGFVGSYLLKRLSTAGQPVRALVRSRSDFERIRLASVAACRLEITDAISLDAALEGVEQVVHLAGTFRELGRGTFDVVHQNGTRRLLQAAKGANVKHVIYISTLGAAPDRIYPYVRSKWLAEGEVRGSGLPFTILRPSLLFGDGDRFLTPLTRLLRKSPYAFIPGYERLRCQPLWVGDLVSCLMRALGSGVGKGEVIPLAGPEQITYEGVIDLLQKRLESSRPKIRLPISLAASLTLLLERMLRVPPLTSGILDIWRLGAITDRHAVRKAYGFTPMPLSEGIRYLLSSDEPPSRRRGRKQRAAAPDRTPER